MTVLFAGFVDLTTVLLAPVIATTWPLIRNQAVCVGLMIRISKFMLVVTQLGATGNRAEVVHALNRSILESATNLEFLATKNDDQFFAQFVRYSLGPERELHDLIQKHFAERGGEVRPIEKRMLESIANVCSARGMDLYRPRGTGLFETEAPRGARLFIRQSS